VSPRDKVAIHRLSTQESSPKTPPDKIIKSSTKGCPHETKIRDLNLQIINQGNVVAKLQRKLLIIRDVASNSNNIDLKVNKIGKDTRLNIGGTANIEDETKCKNVINLQFG